MKDLLKDKGVVLGLLLVIIGAIVSLSTSQYPANTVGVMSSVIGLLICFISLFKP